MDEYTPCGCGHALFDHESDDDREQISDILFTPTKDLDRFIDFTIDEMATMAPGAIEGSMGSGAFGPPNTYNSFKKRNPNKKATSKRPKVKRAKRQRRR